MNMRPGGRLTQCISQSFWKPGTVDHKIVCWNKNKEDDVGEDDDCGDDDDDADALTTWRPEW